MYGCNEEYFSWPMGQHIFSKTDLRHELFTMTNCDITRLYDGGKQGQYDRQHPQLEHLFKGEILAYGNHARLHIKI